MEILLAKSAGFCAGVRRAVELTLHASAAKEGKISTYGPLVHNPQVIELLSFREVACAENIDQLTEGLAVVRTHGVPPQEIEAIEAKGLNVLNATCPKVGKVQSLVENAVKDGYQVIIVGEPEHPEVKGLQGYGGDGCSVISSAEEFESLPKFEKVYLLAQTTQNIEGFERIRDRIAEIYPEVVVKNTICAATRKRQNEIRILAEQVDAMIVIGGRDSGNTRRLVDIAQNECGKTTFWIETEAELSTEDLLRFEKIGVTAGASTPSWIIERVLSYLEDLKELSDKPVQARLRGFIRWLIITNIYTSIGAGALCYVGSLFQQVEFRFSFFAMVFCYVLAMHVLNRFTDTGVDKFRDDPIRQRFYAKHKKAMLALGVAAMLTALAFTVRMGLIAFLIILTASIIGMLYSVRVVPKWLLRFLGFRRLKDIAASKNFFVASAWAVVSVFPLFFFQQQHRVPSTLAAFAFLFLVTGLRSIYMDLSDIASDRLVGRDSVPIVFGEKKTRNLVRGIIVLLFVFCFVASYVKILPTFGYVIAFWALLEFLAIEFIIPAPKRRPSLIKRDLFVDGHFIFAGLAAWAWTVLIG
jgi:(E)-4-hydroxy-3-methyl-but-2-enyl pyrophosphate reductase